MATSPYTFITPFDVTGYSQITASQLQQFVAGLQPNTDRGVVIVSTDASGVPQVPNASENTAWQNCIWVRIGATTVTAYVWNTNGANTIDPSSGASLLKWTNMNATSLGSNSITTDMLQNSSVTNSKIVNVDASKIFGSFNQNNLTDPIITQGTQPTSGDLTGYMPNLSVKEKAITSAKLANSSSVDADRAVTTDSIKDKAVTVAKINGTSTPLQMIRTTAGDSSVVEYFTPNDIVKAANSAVGLSAASVYKQMRINPTGDAYEFMYPAVLQKRSTMTNNTDNTSAICAAGARITTSAQLVSDFGTSGVMRITPRSASSHLMVEVSLELASNQASAFATAGIFYGSSSVASSHTLQCSRVATVSNVANVITQINMRCHIPVASVGNIIYISVRYAGSAGTTYLNTTSSSPAIVGVLTSSIVITELDETV